MSVQQKIDSSLEGEARKAGKSREKGWFQRFKVGIFPQRGHPGKSAFVQMVMKRVGFGDWYREIVVDRDTGELLKKRDHPLHEHQGYGSAKLKRQSPDEPISN